MGEGENMLCNRIKQFREYHKIDKTTLADILEIDVTKYEAFEKGTLIPTIDIISKLAMCYKVTVDEFYGYTPRLTLHSKDIDDWDDDSVEESLLKMSDLSWDEVQLILHYRNIDDKEEVLETIKKKSKNKE